MILINAKCTYCRETIHVNPEKLMGTCSFCRLQFETNKAVENYKKSHDKVWNIENILVTLVVIIGVIVFYYVTLLVGF